MHYPGLDPQLKHFLRGHYWDNWQSWSIDVVSDKIISTLSFLNMLIVQWTCDEMSLFLGDISELLRNNRSWCL